MAWNPARRSRQRSSTIHPAERLADGLAGSQLVQGAAWTLPGCTVEPPVSGQRWLRSGAAGEGKAPSPAFGALLRQLEEEHARQLGELRQEISRLRGRAEQEPSKEAVNDIADPISVRNGRRSVTLAATEEEEMCPLHAPPEKELSKEAVQSIADPSLDAAVGSGGQDVVIVTEPAEEPSERRPSMDSMPSTEPGKQLLKITIKGASGLRRTDWLPGQFTDPYCICSIPGKPELTFQTHVIDNTPLPQWDCEVVIDDYTPGDSLEFVVKDRDWFNADDELGGASLPSSAFLNGDFEGDLQLTNTGKDDGAPSLLHLRVQVAERQSCAAAMRSVWRESRRDSTRSTPADKRVLRPSWNGEIMPSESRALHGQYCESKQRKNYMFDPSASFRLFWDTMGIVLICVDLVWLPMQVFSPPQTTPVVVMNWFALSFWTADIAVTFNTGTFKKGGFLIMNRRQSSWLYFRRWFVPDLALVALEWTFLVQMAIMDSSSALSDGASTARAGKFARISRILRLTRLMRLAKIRELVFVLTQLIDSEWLTITVMVTKNLLTILALNHVVACVWYAVGSSSEDGWVRQAGLEDADVELRYLICLQWSMAQFTPGASPVRPITIGERVYSVSVLALALVVATCFISNITSTLSAVWSLQRQGSTQALLLRKFLRQNHISRALGSRVTRYIDCVLELRQQKVHPSRVQYLTFLSGPLHVELQSELREPQLFVHEFFPLYKQASICAFREVCTTALEQGNFAKNDMLFNRRMEAKYMYFLHMGALVYRTKFDIKRKNKTKLEAGQWCSENALWMQWEHAGDMKALTDVDIVFLNAAKFSEVTRSDPEAYRLAREHCHRFVERVRQTSSFDECSVTDLKLKVRVLGLDRRAEPVAEDEAGALTPAAQDLKEAADLTPVEKDLKEAEDMEAEIIGFSDSEDSDPGPSFTLPRRDYSKLHWPKNLAPRLPAFSANRLTKRRN